MTTTTATSTTIAHLLARVALLTATALAPLVAMLLLARRLAGQLEPLPGGLLVMIGVSAACLMLAWRWAWRSMAWPGVWATRVTMWWPPIVLAIVGLSLSIPGSHPLALVLFWAMLIGEEIAAGWSSRTSTSHPIREAPPVPEYELAAGATQQITRTSDEGVETLVALLRVFFAAGQQNETIHVAFCPPLEGQPSAQCARLRGPECEVKVAAVETYGARLEVKRRGGLQSTDEAVIKVTVTSGVE